MSTRYKCYSRWKRKQDYFTRTATATFGTAQSVWFLQVCPGLGMESYHKNYAKVLGYESTSVRLMSEPFSCVDSPRCELWYKLARNSSIFKRNRNEVLCQPCKKMKSFGSSPCSISSHTYTKVAWQKPSSKSLLVVLSLLIQKKRQLDEIT